MHIVWKLTRRRVTRRLTRLQTTCNEKRHFFSTGTGSEPEWNQKLIQFNNVQYTVNAPTLIFTRYPLVVNHSYRNYIPYMSFLSIYPWILDTINPFTAGTFRACAVLYLNFRFKLYTFPTPFVKPMIVWQTVRIQIWRRVTGASQFDPSSIS